MSKTLYFMCGITDDGGKTFYNKPLVLDAKGLKNKQNYYAKQDEGKWKVQILASASIAISGQPDFHSPSDNEDEHLVDCECNICIENDQDIPF